MERYQVILGYDGTQFLGFQRQEARSRTVQGEVEAALRQLGWQGRSILAAGRTDTGVHASGQVIAFDLEWQHSPEALGNALNAHLPEDVAVHAVRRVPADFSPRYDATARRYRYTLFFQERRDPLRERYAWRVWPAADPVRLQQAAAVLPGHHDFAAFGTPPRAGSHTMRTIFQASWQTTGLDWVFEVTADAFLYHMVRRLVAVQVQIAQGRLAVEAMPQYVQTQEGPYRQGPFPLQGMAPPQGLVLVEVMYPLERITLEANTVNSDAVDDCSGICEI